MNKWIKDHSSREVALAALLTAPLWAPFVLLYVLVMAGLIGRAAHWMLAGF